LSELSTAREVYSPVFEVESTVSNFHAWALTEQNKTRTNTRAVVRADSMDHLPVVTLDQPAKILKVVSEIT
jgi:hypothetical protein